MAASIETQSVSEVFDDLWKTYNDVEKSEEPVVSEKSQIQVTSAIEQCERLIKMVNDLQLFSTNENIDDVATGEIRFMLLSALLAYFTNKCAQKDRYDTVKICQRHYVDFLKLCRDYKVTQFEVPRLSEEQNEDPPINQPSAESRRLAKISRHKEKMSGEKRLNELFPLVEREHVDDEVKREYMMTLVRHWVNVALEEVDALQAELPILEHMAKMKSSGKHHQAGDGRNQHRATEKKQPLRPFIITKSTLQKQVFGLGYPSIPTYTLDEFYQHQVDKGRLPDQGHVPIANQAELSEREQEEVRSAERDRKEEVDDNEALRKARDWDEWKDDHRRGWGNTHNKG